MSHVFPLASNAEEALQENAPKARTKREAVVQNDGVPLSKGLVHDWIRFPRDKESELRNLAEKGRDLGFVQSYEDAETEEIVYAVTYWKVSKIVQSPSQSNKVATTENTTALQKSFNGSARTQKTRRSKRRKSFDRDGKQLDLFSGPNQQGYERRDPNNPKIILALEEGDGTSFGG